jgi:hypothetical protein
MYSVETVESLQAYADRLHREVEASRRAAPGRRTSVRGLLRRARRSA